MNNTLEVLHLNRGIEMAFEVWLGLVFTWLMLLLIYKAESIQSEVG